MELTLEQALLKGIEAHKAGQVQEADRLYTAILQAQPKHPDANHNMGILAVGVGKANEALPFFKIALEANPHKAQFWLSYIDTLIKLDRSVDAKSVLDQAKEKGAKGDGFDKLEDLLSRSEKKMEDPPQDQLQSLISLYNVGQLQQVLDQIEKLLQQFHNSATLYNIQGAAKKGLGQLEPAIDSYKRALFARPHYAEAYNNMGNALKDQGKLDEAIASFNKTLALKPDYAEVKNNLILILKIFSPEKNHAHQLIDIDNEIKVKHNENALPTADQELAIFTLDLLNRLQSVDRDVSTELSQIYRRNKVDLNCRRHFAIFKEKEIIPQFCFRCYKVQVELPTVLDLIRLSALFYEIEFESDLIRKCLVEVRPNIPGSYKGLIYCRGIDQANSVKKQLDVHVSAIDKNLTAKIKKGCSEFPLAFPKYGEVAANEEDAMQYPQEWHTLETRFDDENLILPESYVYPSLKGFCLSDYLIIQKWIDYAKGIGDPTSKLFCDLPIKYKEIWKIAQARIKQ